MRPLITAGATKKGVIARKKKKYKKKSVPRTGFFVGIIIYSGRKLLTASRRRFQALLEKSASERMSILPVGGFPETAKEKPLAVFLSLCSELFTNPLRLS